MHLGGNCSVRQWGDFNVHQRQTSIHWGSSDGGSENVSDCSSSRKSKSCNFLVFVWLWYVFRPERFLDEEGRVKSAEHLGPFGVGKRICPGASLARIEFFMFFCRYLTLVRFSKSRTFCLNHPLKINLLCRHFEEDHTPP